jgi:putative endonuclease
VRLGRDDRGGDFGNNTSTTHLAIQPGAPGFSIERNMARDHTYFVYILASRRNGTLYTGVTNDLIRRVQEHRQGLVDGFTKRYRVKLLVYFEVHQDINEAILREKRIKRWRRAWKLQLIEAENPQWRDLWAGLSGEKE